MIRSIQQGLDDSGLKQEKLHATGLQTLCKIVENAYNSLPIGYSYDRDQDNTEVLKMICPNMLKMGHKNQRQLDGPIRLARGTRDLLDKVEELYKAWFFIWRHTVVPKIMFQPKWYRSDRDLQEGDLVYFQKKEGKLVQPWTVGRVEQVVRSDRDDLIRRVVVKYQNPGEAGPRITDRSIRKLVKLFNVDEHQVQEDLAELQRKVDAVRKKPIVIDEVPIDDEIGTNDDQTEADQVEDDDTVINNPDLQEDVGSSEAEEPQELQQSVEGCGDNPASNTRSRSCNCCCDAHCKYNLHTMGLTSVYSYSKILPLPCELETLKVESKTDWEHSPDHEEIETTEDNDTLTSVLMSLNLQM